MSRKTYIVTLTLGVLDGAERLGEATAIRSEVTSWLENLGADVADLNIELVACDSNEEETS